MNKRMIAAALVVTLLTGCSTINGQDVNSGRTVAGAILGILVVGGLIALAASQAGKPDAVIKTSGPNGNYRTEIYR